MDGFPNTLLAEQIAGTQAPQSKKGQTPGKCQEALKSLLSPFLGEKERESIPFAKETAFHSSSFSSLVLESIEIQLLLALSLPLSDHWFGGSPLVVVSPTLQLTAHSYNLTINFSCAFFFFLPAPWVFCLHVCLCLLPLEARRRQIPWSYRRLWSAMWVLVTWVCS